METKQVTFEVPKESAEIVDLLGAIIDKIKSKAPLAEYAALLGPLMTAIEGVGDLSEEIKSSQRDELAGYLVKVLLEKLLPAQSE